MGEGMATLRLMETYDRYTLNTSTEMQESSGTPLNYNIRGN